MGVSNVTGAKPQTGGACYRATTATPTLPVSTSDALTDFASMGYISDKGIVNSNSPASTNVKAFGGTNVLTTQTERPDTFKVEFLEVLDLNVLKTVYGETNVSGTSLTSGLTVKANGTELEERAFVFDLILRNGVAKRMVLPKAKISSISDITYADGAAVGYEVTLEAFPDSSGNTHYEYIKG